jgi:hypothetical protein
MIVGHPVDWEVSFASARDKPGRLAFSDRYYQRLDVRWRPVRYPPNLDKMVEVYQTHKHPGSTIHEVPHAPEPWRALARKTASAWVVHAGRFFRERRWLVEATVVWPNRRDKKLETAIWDAMDCEPPDAEIGRWRAMGLAVDAPADWDLVRYGSSVGRVQWEFEPVQRPRGRVLKIERLAMPETWLETHPRQWLADQLPANSRILRSSQDRWGDHVTEELITTSRITIAWSLVGRRRLRMDTMWQCPREGRLYHVMQSLPSRQDAIDLPTGFDVHCCRTVPTPSPAPTP